MLARARHNRSCIKTIEDLDTYCVWLPEVSSLAPTNLKQTKPLYMRREEINDEEANSVEFGVCTPHEELLAKAHIQIS